MIKNVSMEEIRSFLNGTNPQERIIKIECNNNDDFVSVVYVDENGQKRIQKDKFYPFCWAKQSVGRLMFGGDRDKIKKELSRNGIEAIGLKIASPDGSVHERMESGFRVMFRATKPMSYNDFNTFFRIAGTPLYNNRKDPGAETMFITVSANEQYMISTGKRLFKGYENYDDLLRMQFDLETEGLNPEVNAITQIGIRTNKGFEKILSIEGDTPEDRIASEFRAILIFFQTIRDISPDIITGHNVENFDWNFIDVRLRLFGYDMGEISKKYLPFGVHKSSREKILKLGGEIETFFPTVMWGFNLTDSLFAVRRAQAIDSSMKKSNLKYVTKYSKINKQNRVYVPGDIISKTWKDTEYEYAFNDGNGNWFKITEEKLQSDRYSFNKENNLILDLKTNEKYEYTTGKYIVERYLLDDIWEADKVEARYNESNFLVGKMLPLSFEKACVMGTAGIWKYIMMAWSYENGLAIPAFIKKVSFTGGLSRLLRVGFVDNVVKLDFNSMYPSIILTYGIKTPIDISGAMSAMLDYVLTEREFYKDKKNEWGKKGNKLKKYLEETPNLSEEEISEIKKQIVDAAFNKAKNDKLQLPLKILANSFFGAYGAGGGIFPWSDMLCAEETTCSGRNSLRLMIKFFGNRGYEPIVGDSFTGDTPFFVKYDNNQIDILTVEEMINNKEVSVDELGREYDYSEKPYKVLCRSGWMKPDYIYRHKTDKPIYNVSDGDKLNVDVTEDHSLFNSNKEEIKPGDINRETSLEYYDSRDIFESFNYMDLSNDRPVDFFDNYWLNSNLTWKKIWLKNVGKFKNETWTKKQLAFYNFIENCVNH